jgi:hypothetical protein
MAISMYQISVPIFVRHLNGLVGCLRKAQAVYAEMKNDESSLLSYRLYPDMLYCRWRTCCRDRPGRGCAATRCSG